MIPPEKSAAVSEAVSAAFGAATIEDIRRIPQDLSTDLVYRIVVQKSPYLLRTVTRIDERMDPGRIFPCMKAAAEAGLAPRVHYANARNGTSIVDFVEAAPLPATHALAELPGILRKLHSLPPFPKTFNYVTAHNGFIWRFRKADILPKDQIEEVFTRYQQVCATYPRLDSDMVSSHMDLKPENILFDGQRLWLTGWQAAFVNDRYFDLAVAANYLLTSEADERTLLDRYFGQPADEYQRSRFFLMRQVVHTLSATVFLLLSSAGKPINRSENLPAFEDLHRRIWEGVVNLADKDLKLVYGMVHWERFLWNLRQPRFDEALRIVSERNTPQQALLLPSAP